MDELRPNQEDKAQMFGKLAFGGWLLHPEQGLLVGVDGQRKLDPRPVAVLLFLCRNVGECVSKERILEEVWGGRAVGEDVLTVAVSQIRKALGDKARQPSYIQTVHGEGYRWLVPVRWDSAAAGESIAGVDKVTPTEPAFTPHEQRSQSLQRWFPFFMVPLVLVVVWFILQGRRDVGGNAQTPATEPMTLAVLPLSNLTGSEDLAYLVDGLTETLISELAQTPRLQVISRTSSVALKGRALTLPEAAEALGAAVILEGAVLRSQNNFVVSLQLIEAKSDRHLWAERKVHSSLSLAWIQNELLPSCIPDLVQAMGMTPALAGHSRRSVDPAAIEASGRGFFLLRRIGDYRQVVTADQRGQLLDQAESKFLQAMTLDPQLADPVLGLAQVKWRRLFSLGHEVQPQRMEIRDLLARALQLDENLAEAYVLQADDAFLFDWSFERADALYQKALACNDSLATAHFRYAQFLLAVGRFEDALQHVLRLRHLDPLAYSIPSVAWIYNMSKRFPEALSELEKMTALEGRDRIYHISAQNILENMGREAEAYAHLTAIFRDSGFNREELDACDRAFGTDQLPGVYRWLLANREARALGQYEPPLSWARYAIVAGETDLALDYLEQALAQRQMELLWVGVDPKYGALHKQPRFQILLRNMGLAPYLRH